MESEQYERIFEKLIEDEEIGDEVREIVEAACLGDAALGRVLAGEGVGAPLRGKEGGGTRKGVPGVTLRSIEVRGFRGIGGMSRLVLEPGPGLTLVTQRVRQVELCRGARDADDGWLRALGQQEAGGLGAGMAQHPCERTDVLAFANPE